MKINDFTDLLATVRAEYVKMSEDLGVVLAPEDLIKFTSNTLLKYLKLYDEPLYAQEKQAVKLNKAINTLPHGFIWRIFHPKLWRIMFNMGLVGKKEDKIKKIKEIKQQDNSNRSSSVAKIPDAIERVRLPPPGTESGQG